MQQRAWKWTFRDAVWLMIIAIVVFWFVHKWEVSRDLQIPDTTFEIVVRGENQKAFMWGQIQEGDPVRQKGSDVVFGTVTAVKKLPAEDEAVDKETGQPVLSELPGLYDIEVTIDARGFSSPKGGTIIDNNLIELNQYFVIQTQRVHMPTRVISIEDKG